MALYAMCIITIIAIMNGENIKALHAASETNELIRGKDDIEKTVLHEAARNGKVEVVNAMLKHFSDGEKRKLIRGDIGWGGTLFEEAISGGKVEVVEALLKHLSEDEAKELIMGNNGW